MQDRSTLTRQRLYLAVDNVEKFTRERPFLTMAISIIVMGSILLAMVLLHVTPVIIIVTGLLLFVAFFILPELVLLPDSQLHDEMLHAALLAEQQRVRLLRRLRRRYPTLKKAPDFLLENLYPGR